MLRDFLKNISSELSNGIPDTYGNNSTALSIRENGPRIIKSFIPINLKDYDVKGSAGRGQWAKVPWVAIFNLLITRKASLGYYLVYLIPSSSKKIIFSLAQSTDEAKKEYKKESSIVLDRQSEIMREKIPEYKNLFLSSNPETGARGEHSYRHGHVYHIEYDSANLPSEEKLREDFNKMLEAYEALFYRGGRDSDNFSINPDSNNNEEITIKEAYKLKVHYSIERPSSSKIKKIKKKLGYICQGCNFNFERVYGELGIEYIEAHHLTPVSQLKEGEVRRTTERDFAVLCSNCHKMIHRLEDSSDLEKLKQLTNSEYRMLLNNF